MRMALMRVGDSIRVSVIRDLIRESVIARQRSSTLHASQYRAS